VKKKIISNTKHILQFWRPFYECRHVYTSVEYHDVKYLSCFPTIRKSRDHDSNSIEYLSLKFLKFQTTMEMTHHYFISFVGLKFKKIIFLGSN